MRPTDPIRASLPLASIFVASLPLGMMAAAGCNGGEPPKVAAPKAPAVVVVPNKPAAPEAKPADDPNAGLVALVCGKRRPCTLLKEHAAGKDERGRSLSAALFHVGTMRHDAEEDAPPEGTEKKEEPNAETKETPTSGGAAEMHPDVTFGPDGETFGMESFGECKQYEYWRVVRDGAIVAEADRVTEICNDGHGASGVGEDAVKVGPSSIEVSVYGGSAWRWSETTTYSLSPFARKVEAYSGFWSLGPNRQHNEVDWTTFSGKATWFSPQCEKDGSAPEIGDDGREAGTEYEMTWIPSLPLDAAFLASGWQSARLDRCAGKIDAGGAAGHLLSGKESTADDTTVRVLSAQGGPLFVEVTDDKVVADDRLEVWVGPSLPSYMDHCIDAASTAGVVSWNVRATDGKVTGGAGKPSAGALTVDRAVDPGGAVRFRIAVPAAQKALTVVYADSDGGKKIERRIATSRLEGGRAATLGELYPAGERASCIVKSGALVPEIKVEQVKNPE